MNGLNCVGRSAGTEQHANEAVPWLVFRLDASLASLLSHFGSENTLAFRIQPTGFVSVIVVFMDAVVNRK